MKMISRLCASQSYGVSKPCSFFSEHSEFPIDHNELMHGQLKNSHNTLSIHHCAKMDDFLPATLRKHTLHLIAKQSLKSTGCICSAITTWLLDRTLRSTALSSQVSFNLPMTCFSLEIVHKNLLGQKSFSSPVINPLSQRLPLVNEDPQSPQSH